MAKKKFSAKPNANFFNIGPFFYLDILDAFCPNKEEDEFSWKIMSLLYIYGPLIPCKNQKNLMSQFREIKVIDSWLDRWTNEWIDGPESKGPWCKTGVPKEKRCWKILPSLYITIFWQF